MMGKDEEYSKTVTEVSEGVFEYRAEVNKTDNDEVSSFDEEDAKSQKGYKSATILFLIFFVIASCAEFLLSSFNLHPILEVFFLIITISLGFGVVYEYLCWSLTAIARSRKLKSCNKK